MESGSRRVFSYSSTHEKTLSDGSIRCRMELHRTSFACLQRTWKTKDPRSARDPQNAVFYLLKSGCQWRLLSHDFPRTVPIGRSV
jgi:transposase